jgi:hypothetical protein
MPQKVLLAGLFVLLLALGGFAFFVLHADCGPMLADPAGAPAASNAGPVEAATTASDKTPAAPAGETTNGSERAIAAVFDETPVRPLPENATWITVKVVEKATGSPLDGALVSWFDETAWDYLTEKDDRRMRWDGELQWHGERLAQLAGWRTRTDAKGLARVTLVDHTTVIAQHSALYGKLQLQTNSVPPVGGYVVELVPDIALTVRVLDDRGSPAAGAPITFAVLDKDGDQTGPFGWATLATSRAPDGLATIEHLQTMRAQVEGDGSRMRLAWNVRLKLPGNNEPGVKFDPAAPPAEPIELRLPPCGSMRVRAEIAGKPVPGFRSVWLANATDGNNHGIDSGGMAQVDADGQARFLFLPLGREFRVNTDASGGLSGKFAGPRNAGQEVDVVLRPADDAMLLAGRLLLPDRAPVADQRVRVNIQGPQLRANPELSTDRDGRFVVNLGSPRKDNKLETIAFGVRTKGEPPRRAEAAARTVRTGIEELGDLVVGDGSVLVAGRLVAGDAPYKGPVGLVVESETRGDGRQQRWRRVDGQLEFHDDVGNFAIRGTLAPGRYHLVANSERVLPIAPIEFALGATDLVVDIDAGHQLAASVLLPEKASPDAITATLVPATPPAPVADNNLGTQRLLDERWKRSLEGHRGGRCDVRWPSLPAGTYALELRLLAVPNALLTIADVVLPPPAGGDPRLVDIDLRPLLRVLTLTLHDADGKPLENSGGVAFPTLQANANDWQGYSFWEVPATCLLPAQPYDLLVCVSGFRPQPVRGNVDQVDVRLDRWPTLTVNVPDVPALPEKARVQVSLQPNEKSTAQYHALWQSGELAEYTAAPRRSVPVVNGKALVPIGDGLFTLRLALTSNRRTHQLDGFEPKQVMSTTSEVTITVPKEQWTKGIDVIQQPPKGDPQPGEFPFNRR